ncbi:hypothetical protein, unlikely [Trypanosoma brucei gambiense DAL972]|uniref:Uncharacterized protein n=1 Tax=Trypanosoma brucei gambiense (strain MHOM/CI/86/DAL972) TaxID=679716 RepID=C9ZUF3_TRYB9|nr:hypothetical protein, unlikely [Trypanosoma brucei gambiense DAL972]CBH13040.1 hypothetical protein, unlikely [Trypanosoma brucei gambiense DAL972]|eukprot:XP_011775318.1 hypothetical protein, unlikely [Trypanosoma brucei gambiense DAL972]
MFNTHPQGSSIKIYGQPHTHTHTLQECHPTLSTFQKCGHHRGRIHTILATNSHPPPLIPIGLLSSEIRTEAACFMGYIFFSTTRLRSAASTVTRRNCQVVRPSFLRVTGVGSGILTLCTQV